MLIENHCLLMFGSGVSTGLYVVHLQSNDDILEFIDQKFDFIRDKGQVENMDFLLVFFSEEGYVKRFNYSTSHYSHLEYLTATLF